MSHEPSHPSRIARDALVILRRELGCHRGRRFKVAEFGHVCEATCAINDLDTGVALLMKAMRKTVRGLKRGRVKSIAPLSLDDTGWVRIRDDESGISLLIVPGACGTVTLRIAIN